MKAPVRVCFVAVLLILLTSGEAFARGGRGVAGRAAGARAAGGRVGTSGLHRSGSATRPNINRSSATRPALNTNALRNAPGQNGPRTVPPAAGRRTPHAATAGTNARLHDGRLNAQTQAARIRQATGARYANMFTPAWYRNHPAAWHAMHPHADLWAAATWAALAGWVGVNGQPVVYGGGGDSTVYYIDGSEEPVSTEEPNQSTVETGGADELQDAVPDATTGDWLPLGVFALVPNKDSDQAHYILQLAINKQGVIGGSYYDTVADSSLPLQGSIDKATQKAVWTIGPNKTTLLETDLKGLTEAQTPVRVRFGKDRMQEWLLVRLENGK